MRSAFVISALAALAAANPGAVSASIAPSGGSPAGCSKSYNGNFGISPTNISSDSTKRSLKARDTDLTISLSNGVLKDSLGRTGYVASNQQFQFDKPPQAGAIYTAGFSICSNGSLSLGDDSIWYSCLSGSFYNLYFKSQGAQCFPVTLQVVGGSSSATTGAATTGAATSGATGAAPSAACTEYVDGQPQCTTAAPPAPVCSEYVDGQPQCTTAAAPSPACSEYVDGQPQCATAAPKPACSEYVDGQPQCGTAAPPATTAAVCSEYVDGQPQCATTAAPPAPACSEYVDGQPQCATTAAPPAPSAVCSEYVDGQPQCATTAAPPAPVCSEYVDGQPQCTTAAPPAPSPACSEYVDGQPQCSVASTGSAWNGVSPTGVSPPIATGAASTNGKELFGLAAGVLAFAALL